MNARWMCAALGAAAVALVPGCASVSPDPAFAEVEKAALDRAGVRLSWNRGTPEDKAVEQAVAGLLNQELTAGQAVQIALLRNRRLRATYEDLSIAQADLVQAGLLSNPTLHFEIRFGGAPIELNITKDFVDLLLMGLRKRSAAARLEHAKLKVTEAVLHHVADVKAAYYALQGAMQLLEMRRTVAQATETAADAAGRLHKAGNITDLERDKNRIQHEQALLDLGLAEDDVLAAREALTALMGLWGAETAFRVHHRLPELPAEEVSPQGLESAAIAGRPDLAAARFEIESAARELGITKVSAWIPTLAVDGHMEREPGGPITAGPGIEFALPIFDQGQAAKAKAAAELNRSRERYAALAVEIRSQVRAARNRLLSARRRVEHFRRIVLPLRNRIVRETLLHYNAMQFGVFHLLQARQEEIEAGRGYVESLREYWTARTELEKALGGALPQPGSNGSRPPASEKPHEHNPHEHHKGAKP